MAQTKTPRVGAVSVSLKEMVHCAKAVGHPVRLRILSMLNARSLCVCQMAAILELAYPTVSGHLAELRRCGLVLEDKRGKLVFNHLNRASPFAPIVARALALARNDETVRSDRALLDRVSAVSCSVLTRAGLNLKRVGIVRKALRASFAARA